MTIKRKSEEQSVASKKQLAKPIQSSNSRTLLPARELQSSQQKLQTAMQRSPMGVDESIKVYGEQDATNDDVEGDMVRMQSGKKPITNATILRDHISEIKQAFSKFVS